MSNIIEALNAVTTALSTLPLHDLQSLYRENYQQIDPATRTQWKKHIPLARKQAITYARAYIALAIRKRPKKK